MRPGRVRDGDVGSVLASENCLGPALVWMTGVCQFSLPACGMPSAILPPRKEKHFLTVFGIAMNSQGSPLCDRENCPPHTNVQVRIDGKLLVHQSVLLLVARLPTHNVTFSFLICQGNGGNLGGG
jgi:hypothetical protein